MQSLLLSLPEELQCEVIASTRFTLDEITNIATTSQRLKQLVHECLTYLQMETPATLDINFITSFPQLIVSEYPIVISSWEELVQIARHPNIKRITLDIPDLETVMPIHGILIDFITIYLRQHDWEGVAFTFTLATLEITITPGNLCIIPLIYDDEEISSLGLNFVALFNYLNTLQPIKHCITPYLPPPSQDLIWLDLLVPENAREFYDPNFEDLVIRDNMIGPLLSTLPRLFHFGMLPAEEEIEDAFIEYDLPEDLLSGGYVFPNITSLDYAVKSISLPALIQVFPNVKEPLLEKDFFYIAEDVERLEEVRAITSNFTGFRVLNKDNLRKIPLLFNLPVRIDQRIVEGDYCSFI